MQFHTKTVFDSLLDTVDFVFSNRFLAPLSPRIPDFNGISESESSISDSKDMDSRFNNHKACEFWNPDCFALSDHHIVLRPSLSIAHS